MEVAAGPGLPLFMLLDEDGVSEAEQGSGVGENADGVGTAFDQLC